MRGNVNVAIVQFKAATISASKFTMRYTIPQYLSTLVIFSFFTYWKVCVDQTIFENLEVEHTMRLYCFQLLANWYKTRWHWNPKACRKDGTPMDRRVQPGSCYVKSNTSLTTNILILWIIQRPRTTTTLSSYLFQFCNSKCLIAVSGIVSQRSTLAHDHELFP